MKIIFSDFDGTLTTNGKIGAIFFDILEFIQHKNIEFIIVSGRSLSWGHFFLTHFPINYCLMEGGGVLVYKDESGNIKEENMIDDRTIGELIKIEKQLVQAVPKCILSADSFGRRTDRAIEIYQMHQDDQNACEDFLNKNKIHFSKSDVHLNFWLGDISKAKGVSHFLKKYRKNIKTDECLYFGDARNDESMFEYFEHTVGVSNISKILNQLTFKPKVILQGPENKEALGVLGYLKTKV